MGGKARYLNFLLPLMPHPPNLTYVEPFGGGAAVLLNRPRSRTEVYSDLDDRLVNFLTEMRDNSALLAQLISTTPLSRQQYRVDIAKSDDPTEDARRFFSYVHQSYQGSERNNNPNNWSRKYSSPKRRIGQNFGAVAKRLRGVELRNCDAFTIMREHDAPNTVFYVDPPYLHTVMGSDHSGTYRHGFHSVEQHEELLGFLDGLLGHVCLSGYRSDLYDAKLRAPRWVRHDDAPKTTPINRSGRSPKVESAWVKQAKER